MASDRSPDFNLVLRVGEAGGFVTVGAGWAGRKEGSVKLRLNPGTVLDRHDVNAEGNGLYLFVNTFKGRPPGPPAPRPDTMEPPVQDPVTSRSAMAKLQTEVADIRRKHHGGAPPDDDIPF